MFTDRILTTFYRYSRFPSCAISGRTGLEQRFRHRLGEKHDDHNLFREYEFGKLSRSEQMSTNETSSCCYCCYYYYYCCNRSGECLCFARQPPSNSRWSRCGSVRTSICPFYVSVGWPNVQNFVWSACGRAGRPLRTGTPVARLSTNWPTVMTSNRTSKNVRVDGGDRVHGRK